MWWSIGILILAVLILMLQGRKRSGYKKALSMYEEGNYSEAQDVFQSLKNYKDSAQMAQQCNYHMAMGCMMEEEYRKAREFFLEAGDYADTKKILEDLPQKILTKFLEENGEISSAEISDYKVTLYPVSGREIGVRYFGHKSVDGTEQGRRLDMSIAFDAPKTTVQGESTGNALVADNIKYEIAEKATGTLNVAEYQHGDKVCWGVRYSYCANRRNISNVPYGWGSVLENYSAQYLCEMLQGIQSIMKAYDLPVTLQDIGFVSVNG